MKFGAPGLRTSGALGTSWQPRKAAPITAPKKAVRRFKRVLAGITFRDDGYSAA